LVINIKGLDRTDPLYPAVENAGNAYGITSIRIIKWPWGFNAFAVGLLGSIFITQKVIDNMTVNDIEGILGHEFSHIFNRDGTVRVANWLLFLILLLLFGATSSALVASRNSTYEVAGLILFLMFMVILIMGYRISNWVTTNLEYRADRDAVYRLQHPEYFRNALVKYMIYNANQNRPGFISKFLEGVGYTGTYFIGYTHPGWMDRIQYIDFLIRIKQQAAQPATVAAPAPVAHL
jgi:Zn-dependent protease with chaperone function